MIERYLLFQQKALLVQKRFVVGPFVTMPIRYFAAVKELPWCASKSNAVTKEKDRWSNTKRQSIQCVSCDEEITSSGSVFGIIVAMDQNRIIGVNNRIPWHIAEDRKHFEKVTAGKTLIVGKNTFHEEGYENFSHLNHCRRVIVISSSMTNDDITNAERHMTNTKVHLVKSFNEALELSTSLWRKDEPVSRSGNVEEIDCWIGGGQRIYEEAIRHPKAVELQLTIIHAKLQQGKDFHSGVALFPAKYRYDNAFEEVKELKRIGKAVGSKEFAESNVSYSFHVWKKKGIPRVK